MFLAQGRPAEAKCKSVTIWESRQTLTQLRGQRDIIEGTTMIESLNSHLKQNSYFIWYEVQDIWLSVLVLKDSKSITGEEFQFISKSWNINQGYLLKKKWVMPSPSQFHNIYLSKCFTRFKISPSLVFEITCNKYSLLKISALV